MSCESCKLKEADKELLKAIKNARQDAQQQEKSFAIIKTETGYEILEAFQAYKEGYGPCVVKVVSGYNTTSA